MREGALFTVRELTTIGNSQVYPRSSCCRRFRWLRSDPSCRLRRRMALHGIASCTGSRALTRCAPDFNLTMLPGGRVDLTLHHRGGTEDCGNGIQVAGTTKPARLVLGGAGSDDRPAAGPHRLSAVRARTCIRPVRFHWSTSRAPHRRQRVRLPMAARPPMATAAAASGIRPVQLTVNVREVQRTSFATACRTTPNAPLAASSTFGSTTSRQAR